MKLLLYKITMKTIRFIRITASYIHTIAVLEKVLEKATLCQ